jgi:hypothetical protein
MGYNFNVKYSSQSHVLKLRCPDDGVILGDSGNFRSWGLFGGSKSLEGGTWGNFVLILSLSFSLTPVHNEVKAFLRHTFPVP